MEIAGNPYSVKEKPSYKVREKEAKESTFCNFSRKNGQSPKTSLFRNPHPFLKIHQFFNFFFNTSIVFLTFSSVDTRREMFS